MRLTALFIMLFLSGSCLAQQQLKREVLLSHQDGTTGSLLAELDSVPGIVLSYSTGVLDLTKKVVLKGTEKTVEDYLASILKGHPVRYLEKDGKIFIIASEPVKKKFTISGYIIAKNSGERLISTSVYLPHKSIGTTSNNYGFYSITLEQGMVELQVSHTGYHPYAAQLDLQQDIVLDIALEQHVVRSQPVVISSESRLNVPSRSIGKTEMSSSLIKSMPAMMGEPDVMKTLQMLPGVQSGNEGTSGLIVRGGSADQNLILLDGVAVYNASHAFGVFSIFNADAVANVEILKSGFPASYGGRLSSVVNVHMKEGDKFKYHGEGGLGIIFSKFTLEGPLKKGKSSFMISGRRTYADLIIRPILRISNEETDVHPFFSDVNVKANFPLGKRDHIYTSLYRGKDKFSTEVSSGTLFDPSARIRSDYGFSWGNVTALVRWNHEFGNRTFSNFTFTHSRFNFDTDQVEKSTSTVKERNYYSSQNYRSSITDWTFKGDIDYLPMPGHFVKTGFSATFHHYQPGKSHVFYRDTVVRIDQEIENERIKAGEFDLYVDDDIRLSSRMKMNAGLRLSAFVVDGKTFFAAQPRLNWLYKLTDKWNLKASYGRMNQFIHLLTNSNLGLPTDLWLPVTRKVPPQSAHHLSAGVTWKPDKSIEATMEIYYKTMKNVIEYTEGSGFGSAYDNWEGLVERGSGRTFGAEWMLQKKKGALTGLLSYTLSSATRQFDGLNNGLRFPYKYDRRHELKTALVWEFSKGGALSANWFFATGNAISLPTSSYYNPYLNRFIDVHTERNNSRMPTFHRLDLSLKFTRQKRKHEKSWILSVHNVYNQFNAFFRYKTYDYPNSNVIYRDVSVLPFLPSVSYHFKF